MLPILYIAAFKRREKRISLYQTENIYSSKHFLNQSVKVLSLISGLRIWCPLRKFGHSINLKGLLYLAPSIRLKSEANFFIREILEVFYFPSDFIVVAENF